MNVVIGQRIRTRIKSDHPWLYGVLEAIEETEIDHWLRLFAWGDDGEMWTILFSANDALEVISP